MKRTLLLLGLFFIFVNPVFAQDATSNDFNIRVFGGADDEAPTTPVLSATVITPTQVDLTWSTSTDNFLVSGYRIFKSGEFIATSTIATTSLQSFSDTGLTPSTTVSYQVQAFDASFNYSSTSNIVTVTTPGIPVVIPVKPGQATAARTVIEELIVTTGISTSLIELETTFPSRVELRWGRSDLYELGYVVSNVFKRKNNFLLEDLEPGTTYAFEIVGFTPLGIETLLQKSTFTTDKEKEIIPPPNVNRFGAVVDGSDVDLSWLIPTGVDAQYVRIVRNYFYFPRFPTDGAVVYQGLGNEFTDEGVLDTYSPVYYTAFLYDVEGNVSSGAIALVYALDEDGLFVDTSTEVSPLDGATSTINQERLKPGMMMPTPSEIIVQQRNLVYSMYDSPLEFNNHRQISVSIPASSVAGNLKSIIATIVDPTNNKKTYSFLLRINNDRTAYTGSFPNFDVIGQSQLKVEIYDFEAFVVASYQTQIIFSEYEETNEQVLFPDIFLDGMNVILMGTIILSVSTWLLLWWRRKHAESPVTA